MFGVNSSGLKEIQVFLNSICIGKCDKNLVFKCKILHKFCH